MTTPNTINDNLSVDNVDYNNCIGVLEHEYVINGVNANLRMHYIKFDGNGQPMISALANMLYNYIIDYCIAAKNRPEELTTRQATQLTREARSLFRRPNIGDDKSDKTGEAGELLLYFLTEAVLKAPQLVSKMELKTNHRDEVKGSDGIHARYNDETDMVDFYFGESKLYKSSSGAIGDAIKSVQEYHQNEMYKHEFTMVTKHFKYADDKTKEEITSLILNGEPGQNVCIKHACLVGYDFKGFDGLSHTDASTKIQSDFLGEFHTDGERLTKLIQKRFDEFDKKFIKFDVFFIPFPSVSDFRNAFNKALG